MVKLDVSVLRYLSKEDFRVLSSVEQGMKNHEVWVVNLFFILCCYFFASSSHYLPAGPDGYDPCYFLLEEKCGEVFIVSAAQT